jgi:Family of unknown function (DUF6194)
VTINRILETVRSFDGILVLAPEAGGPHPEIAWGDFFFYFAPDGEVPTNIQPFATIVTKDYPYDVESQLGNGRWRLNIHVGKTLLEKLVGDGAEPVDFAEPDVFIPHPMYGELGWVSVVNPGERTLPRVLELLQGAFESARKRADRRAQHPGS